jgi:acyl-CoA synthetase (AMP-forming)/AMP-acid ligase II
LFSSALKDQLLDELPNRMILDAIGSSETGFGGADIAQKGDTHAGGPRVRIDPSTTVLDDQGNAIEPGSDTVGFLARSGHLPVGYYKDDETTQATFKVINGVRYAIPGDYARVESDGTVTLLGRGSVSINSGGEKIYPEEVESVVKQHPAVFDALVVGVPDPRFGSQVAALVAPRPEMQVTLAELDAFVRAQISGYKVPRSLWLVDEIRRTPAGKADYRWAAARTESTPADETNDSHLRTSAS